MSGSGWEGVGGAVGRVCVLDDAPPTASHLPRPRSVSTRRAYSSLVTKMRHPDTAKRPLHRESLCLTQTRRYTARARDVGSWIWCSSGHPGTAGTHPLAPPRWVVVPSVIRHASLPPCQCTRHLRETEQQVPLCMRLAESRRPGRPGHEQQQQQRPGSDSAHGRTRCREPGPAGARL